MLLVGGLHELHDVPKGLVRILAQHAHDQVREQLPHVRVVDAADQLGKHHVPHPRLHGLCLLVDFSNDLGLVQIQLRTIPGQLKYAVQDKLKPLVPPVERLQIASHGEGHQLAHVERAHRGAARTPPLSHRGPPLGCDLLLQELVEVRSMVEPSRLIFGELVLDLCKLRLGHLRDQQLRGGLRGPSRSEEPSPRVLHAQLHHVLQSVVAEASGVHELAPLQLRPQLQLRRRVAEACRRVLHHDRHAVLPAQLDELQLNLHGIFHQVQLHQRHAQRTEHSLPRHECRGRRSGARQNHRRHLLRCRGAAVSAARQPCDVGQHMQLQEVLVCARVRLAGRGCHGARHLEHGLRDVGLQGLWVLLVQGEQRLPEADLEVVAIIRALLGHRERLPKAVPARELPGRLASRGSQLRSEPFVVARTLDEPQGGLEPAHVLVAAHEPTDEVLSLLLPSWGAGKR
mmetsp:Transcript_170479/g.546727  ORF Transcript_170479/g.546727 Transcript_170479/m.546727 type:complete len:456 (+) Transcript_170479:1500-2867(+)